MAQTAQINIRVDEKQAQGSVDTLNKSLQGTEKTTASLRAQLRQVTQELQGLEPGSARFNELSQRAGQLRDTIQDTNAVINATAGNLTENLAKGLTSITQIGVQGFQGIMGAAAMLGVESEDLQKTMVALQGAMALSQSLEFFGGLEDRVTEIKASFQGLGQALGILKTEQTAAAVGAATLAAAEGASGAAAAAATPPTIALGTAMKALPVVAIAAALVAIGYAIYEYIGANKKAAKEEEKRKKNQEEQIKLYGAASEKMNDEIAGFGALIGMLKQTNAGSKERSSLITEINSKYGTTLKNLRDEKAFQDQLNNSLINFIALQKARFKQESGETRLKQLFAEEERLLGQLETQKKLDAQEKKRQQNTDNYMGSFEKQNKMNEGRVQGTQEMLNKNRKAQEELSKGTLQAYNDEKEALGKLGIKDGPAGGAGGGNYGGALDKQNELLDKRRKLLDEINSRLEREKDATKQLEQLEIDREELGDGVYNKRTKQEIEIRKLELSNEEFRNQLIERATERQIDALEERFVNGTMTEEKYISEIERIRQEGANNLLSVEEDLLSKKDDLLQDEIGNIKEASAERVRDAEQTAELIYYQMGISKVQFDKEMALAEIDTSNKTEEEKKKLRLETLKYYEEVEIQQANNLLKIQSDILYEKYQDDLKLAQENNESTLQIEAQYQKDLLDLEQGTAKKIQDIQNQTTEDRKKTFTENIAFAEEQLSLWGGKVMEIASAINDLLAQQTQQQIDNINVRYNTESDKLKSLYDQKILSEEEFNAQSKALAQQREQEEIKLKRKQFYRDKGIQTVTAIMNGAQSVLAALATAPPASYIMAALNAGLAAVQVATISQQQFKAARGGIVPGSGPGNIDSVPSLLAPGEAVINANSAAMFPNTLSMINQAGGGISLAPEMPSQGSSGSGTIFTDNRSNQPVRAYVVETEITNTQKRVNRIERSVEF